MPFPGKPKPVEFKYGDLVEFVYDVTDVGNKTLHGRIYGRVAPRYSSAKFQTKHTYYVVQLVDKIDDDIEVDLIGMMMAMVGDMELEWGHVPAQPYVTIPEHMLTQLFGSSMIKRFKEKGLCPRCGDPGYWKVMALFCPWHGQFM